MIKTRYGRQVKVTGDHSVFRKNRAGLPEAVPVRELQVGDYIAIPAYLPVVEQDLKSVNIAESLMRQASQERLWEYVLVSPALRPVIEEQREFIIGVVAESERFGAHCRKRAAYIAWWKFRRDGMLPLFVIDALMRHGPWRWPADTWLRPYKSGGGTAVRNMVEVTDDLLWLLGLYVAEGCSVSKGGDYRLLLSSDQAFVERAIQVLAVPGIPHQNPSAGQGFILTQSSCSTLLRASSGS
jgi:UDP-glucuronate decarboxylase